MATLTSENVREELRKTKAEAAELYASADKLKKDMVASGVNPLEDKDAFSKVDEAFKAYSSKADAAADMEHALARMAQIDALSDPSISATPSRPYGGNDGVVRGSNGLRPYGAAFVASEAYQRLRESGTFESDAAFKAQVGSLPSVPILDRDRMEAELLGRGFQAATVTGGSSTSAGAFVEADRQPGFIEYRLKRPTLASMVGAGATDSDLVEYVEQSAPTHAAAETAETDPASESTYAFVVRDTTVKEITHFVPVTRRAMADAGQISTIIDGQLVRGAVDRLDTQIATGGADGENLRGIYETSNVGDQALGVDTHADAIHKGITQIRVAAGVFGEPDAVGMHPNDWQKLRLAKDADERYHLGPAGMAGAQQIWGIPVVASTVFTEGSPLAGEFRDSSTLWVREGISVSAGLNGDDFKNRRVTMLATTRVAFAVTRPGGFCIVTGF